MLQLHANHKGTNMQNQTLLQNLFTEKQPLFILSSTRAKKDFYIHFTQKSHLDFNLNPNLDSNNEVLQNCFLLFDFTNKPNYSNIPTILPTALTIAEFFTKIAFTKECMIPKNIRDFFMFQALQNVKHDYKHKTEYGFLNFETSFMLFLQTSSVLLQFYDELREHKIPITKESLLEFSQIDSYEEYSEQLLLVAAIYEEYSALLQANNLTDSLYSNTHANGYEIFSQYLQSFSIIHIELEGFISPLQYEILSNASKITPIFLHFKTDYYNIGHFRFLDKPLEPFKSYIYNIKTGELLCQDTHKLQVENIKLYKTTKPFSQANLAIFLANKWQEEILRGEASENDFAIILPNEDFCHHLITLDSYNLFNFAMGIHIAYLESYNTLVTLHDIYMQTSKLDIEPLLSFLSHKAIKNTTQIQALQTQCNQDSTIIDTPNIAHLEMILTILFASEDVLLEQMIKILATFNLVANRQFFNIKTLTFEHIFMLFMREISGLTTYDVSGGKIRVIGALEARNLHFKEALILDFTDDYIPNVTHDDMFLNSKIRSHYNMPTRLDKENLYKHHYYNIMKNTQTPHISFVSNDKKIPSSMLFELHCNILSAKSIDTLFSYYDKTKQNDTAFYEDTFKPFNDSKLSRLSATALNTYQDCKRKFYFRYIESLKEETTQSQHVGTIIHDWLYKAYTPYQGKVLTQDSINEIESSFYASLQSLHNLVLNANSNTATEMQLDMITFMKIDNFSANMKAFFDYERERVQTSCIQLLGLEYNFEVPYQNYTFLGFVDRIDKVDSKIIFYDYKTGSKLPSSNNLQMAFYLLSSPYMQILQSYSNLNVESAYYHLSANDKSKMIQIQKDNILKQNIDSIHNILNTFGIENAMTDELSICKSCSYSVLCNRD